MFREPELVHSDALVPILLPRLNLRLMNWPIPHASASDIGSMVQRTSHDIMLANPDIREGGGLVPPRFRVSLR
jgi:hypothetical protein